MPTEYLPTKKRETMNDGDRQRAVRLREVDLPTLDFLIGEARDRLKAERDSANHVYSRAGVYLVICGLFLSALLRFAGMAPQSWNWFASLAVSLLGASTLLAIVTLGLALLRIKPTPQRSPLSWLRQLESESLGGRPIGTSYVQFKRDYLQNLCEATEEEIRENSFRYQALKVTSFAVYIGLAVFGMSMMEHLGWPDDCLGPKSPETSAPAVR
jgi:hypothetical protein